jgi:iron-sulfur cluster assembly protein
MAITLTEAAANRVRDQLTARGRGIGLHLSVKEAGCSGFSYVVDFADQTVGGEAVFETQGVRVFVPHASLAAVDGTTIDYVRQGLNESFRFHNPNMKGECGCGESFTV